MIITGRRNPIKKTTKMGTEDEEKKNFSKRRVKTDFGTFLSLLVEIT